MLKIYFTQAGFKKWTTRMIEDLFLVKLLVSLPINQSEVKLKKSSIIGIGLNPNKSFYANNTECKIWN